METPKRKPSSIRKPPPGIRLNTPTKVDDTIESIAKSNNETDELKTPKTKENDDTLISVPKSPVDKLRFSNPNLQPLSDSETKQVQKWSHRHSYQPLPTPPPSTGELTPTTTIKSSSSEYKLSLKSTRHSIGSITDLKSNFIKRPFTKSKLNNENSISSQTFWKYHILEFGDQYYLTTNPDSKHLYCRHAPGIYVELRFPMMNKTKDISGKSGFQLLFRDQDDEQIFMTVIKNSKERGGEICCESLKKFYEDSDNKIKTKEGELDGATFRAKEIEISELRHKTLEETSVKFCRYQLKDTTGKTWNVGSIPSFKSLSSSKLKNKRFIYFHEPNHNNCLACFRPCEQRLKKRIMKKLKGGLTASYIEENTDESRILNNGGAETEFYSAGDGIFKENPPDDSPSDVKLGWITVYDEVRLLKTPGVWEMVIGYTLAVGIDRMLNERLQNREVGITGV